MSTSARRAARRQYHRVGLRESGAGFDGASPLSSSSGRLSGCDAVDDGIDAVSS